MVDFADTSVQKIIRLITTLMVFLILKSECRQWGLVWQTELISEMLSPISIRLLPFCFVFRLVLRFSQKGKKLCCFNSFSYETFAGKIKTHRSSIFFFTRNEVQNIYKFIFVWIVYEMIFSVYFSFRVNKKKNGPSPRLAKISSQTSKRYSTLGLINGYSTSARCSCCKSLREQQKYQVTNVRVY